MKQELGKLQRENKVLKKAMSALKESASSALDTAEEATAARDAMKEVLNLARSDKEFLEVTVTRLKKELSA